MTGGEKLEAIFAGEMVDQVPFALKGWRVPKCEMEQRLLDEGMCILDARSVYGSKSPNVETETQKFSEEGVNYTRTIIRTPKGELSNLSQSSGGARTESTSWRLEFLFKRPEDYDAVEFMIRDRRYFPSYDGFLKAQEEVGDMAYFKTGAPGCPLHDIMYGIMGLETFSSEWAERRDQILKLHDAIVENQREVFSIVAKSPAKLVQCGGNYSPEVLGKQRFVDFVLPHWEEAGGVLHVTRQTDFLPAIQRLLEDETIQTQLAVERKTFLQHYVRCDGEASKRIVQNILTAINQSVSLRA